jgi:hypothetical protein
LLALADRVRRRVLQAILIRQSEFNQQASASVAGLAARLEAAERDRDQLLETVERLEARLGQLEDRAAGSPRTPRDEPA